MLRKILILSAVASLGAVSLAAGGALAAVAPNTPTPMPKVKAKMKPSVDKISTRLFGVASLADPDNGPDQKLPDAKGWAQDKADALALKADGDWLQDPKIGKTKEPEWMKHAKGMSDLSAAAAKAAGDKNAKALAQAANDMSDNCAACHKVYKKQS